MPGTLAEIYCARHHLEPERFPAHLLQRTLHPLARLLAPFLRLRDADHFLADREFVRDVGYLTRGADFPPVMGDFIYHHTNRQFLRRRLRLRISARRMQQVVLEIFPEEAGRLPELRQSVDPFSLPPRPPA